MGNQEWNTLVSDADLGDSAEFVSAFFGGDSVHGESSFDVVDKTEAFVGLLDRNDVHETGWEFSVGSYFSIDFHQTLLENLLYFDSGKRVVKSVTEEDHEWETLTLLVWTLGRLWRVDTGQFVQHPVGWGIQTLQVLFLTTRHDILGPNFC
jgi:hypothetical protein